MYRELLYEWKRSLSCCQAMVQGTMRHCLIVPSFCCTVLLLAIFTVLTSYFGFWIIIGAAENQSIELNYGSTCADLDIGTPCEVFFFLNETMRDVNIYYKLDDFYSNHKEFVMPRGHYKFMRGNSVDNS